MNGDGEMAHFLLLHGADCTAQSKAGETYLQFAVRYRLASIVQELCGFGVDVNVRSSTNGDPVLWEALVSGTLSEDDSSEEIASILVQNKCDTDFWHQTREGFYQTLLHRALDENKENVAIFLIRSGCDISCIRKPGPDGKGSDDCDGQTPVSLIYCFYIKFDLIDLKF